MTSRGAEVHQLINPAAAWFNSVGTTPIGYDVTGAVVLGQDYINRIGRLISLQRLFISGQLVGGQSNSATDDNRNVFRILVAICDIGTTFTSAVFTVNGTVDPRTMPGLRRVLYDRMFSLNSPGRDSAAGGYMPATRMVRVALRVRDRVTYTIGAGVGLNSNEGIYIWMVSDSAAVPHPGFESGSYGITFTDR
jgi:hypothetical protein